MRINPYKMFVGSFLPNWLRKRKEISMVAKVVYARLAQYAGEDGCCYPKQETIVDEVGSSIASVKRAIKELVIYKLIEIEKRGLTKANVYYFLHHEWMDMSIDTSRSINLIPSTDQNDTSVGVNLTLHSIRESSKIFNEESVEYGLSQYLYQRIKANDPKYKEPDFQKWAKHIDLMMRMDKREPIEIGRVIQFAQEDDFWKTNILSTEKLRKQYTKLLLKMKGKNNGGRRQTITNDTIRDVAAAAKATTKEDQSDTGTNIDNRFRSRISEANKSAIDSATESRTR